MVSKDVPIEPDKKVQVCFKLDTGDAELLSDLASKDHRTRAGFTKNIVLEFLEEFKKSQEQ